jgi:membrane protein implicated in regulation of membrane protease activity
MSAVDDFEHGMQIGFALMLGAILLITGLVLIATLLLWFVGVVFVLASGYPLYRVEIRRIRRQAYSTTR